MEMSRAKKIPTRVLLAEDEVLVGDVIEHELEKGGYEIVGRARNGQLAVELTNKLKPDVVIMDIAMPKMNGLEAMRRIFDTCPVPVILLTAHDTESFIVDAGMIGAAGYLVKPSNIREMDRAITIGLARFNDIMELRRMNARLQEALEKVRILSGLVPICGQCNKVRDDSGAWRVLDEYLETLTGVKLMHAICPECKASAEHMAVDERITVGRRAAAAEGPPPAPAESEKSHASDHEVVISGDALQVFKLVDIKFIEAEDDYSIVHTTDGKKHVVRRPVNKWETLVPRSSFLRIHRSCIVNLNYVLKIEKWFDHSYRVFIRDEIESVVMSRRYGAALRGKLNKAREE